MRYKYGGDGNSVLWTQATDHDAYVDVSGAVGTVWFDEAMTQRCADLALDVAGSQRVTTVTASTSDGRFSFFGPDGYQKPLFVSFGGGAFAVYAPLAISDVMTSAAAISTSVASAQTSASAAASSASQAQAVAASLGQTAQFPDGGKHIFTRTTDPAADTTAGVVNGDVWLVI